MRYTRYNYKKKNNNAVLKFILSIVITVAIAAGTGLGVAKIIFNVLPINNAGTASGQSVEQSGTEGQTQGQDSQTQELNGSTSTAFDFIQCGYFSSKDNATQILNKIGSGYGSFIVEDGGKFRVLAGVYSNENVQTALDDLKAKGVESVKVSINLNSTDKIQSQIAGICDGYLKILSTTFNEDTKYVETQDFKTWVSNLENIAEGDSVEILSSLKTYIAGLPNEINKEDVSKEMDYLYQVLSNFKQ